MQVRDITLLLAIIIITIISSNHEMLTKKNALDKEINHHKQIKKSHKNNPLLHHKLHHLRSNTNNGPNYHLLEQKPIHPHLKSKFCGPMQTRIIDGNIADEGAYPRVLSITVCGNHTTHLSIKHCGTFCGGSIITRFHILTTAHCLVWAPATTMLVRVGVNDLSKSQAHGTVFSVSSYVIHKKYDAARLLHNIGIIRLKYSITYTDLIQPVCINGLHFQYHFPNKNVAMAGWGRISPENPNMSIVLKCANLYIYDFNNCKKDIKKCESKLNFCANVSASNEGYGCKGDTGSGLLPVDSHLNTENIIVGIYSSSAYNLINGVKHCAPPMIFINVSTYAQWINEYVGK